ncbi:hypothetical protein PIROE2DRAFT_9095 [Piromyces sp. E2]|nr:hypothetical protein PIROE2DRAFT_9095 [Piromyces sp. E2]|eukprot:OUM64193.1 hypothetical protein PIROE2DRAFT_9095 [Piromyces sp. E2]
MNHQQQVIDFLLQKSKMRKKINCIIFLAQSIENLSRKLYNKPMGVIYTENNDVVIDDFELPTCTNEAITPDKTCVENAADGEICVGSSGKLYESGKETCREYVDYKYKSKYQFFNARYKRVLRQKSIVGAYRCTVDTTNGRLSDCNIYVNKLPMITTVPSGTPCVEGAA